MSEFTRCPSYLTLPYVLVEKEESFFYGLLSLGLVNIRALTATQDWTLWLSGESIEQFGMMRV